jgi:hypothetical protein
VIVICPSCGTSYTHAVEERPSARSARCSRCAFTFPIPSGRSYRVDRGAPEAVPSALAERPEVGAIVAQGTVPAPRSAAPPVARPAPDLVIGMDDPALESSLGKTALRHDAGRPRQAMTYWVVADEVGASPVPEPRDRAAEPTPEPAIEQTSGQAIEPMAERAPRQNPRLVVALAGGAGMGMVCGAALAALADGSFRAGAAVGCASGIALVGGLLRWNKRTP